MLRETYRVLSHEVMHFGFKEWVISFGIVMVIGAVCLRGFGSRSGY